MFWRLKMRNCLVMLVLLVLLSTSAFALTATTLSGMIQMGLESVPTTFEKSIGVRNENNGTVAVEFIPSPDIKGNVVMEAYNITLQPNETRFVKFNFTVTEMKKQTNSIVIKFSDPNLPKNQSQDQFAVSTALVVIPKIQPNATNASIPTNVSETNISNATQNTTPINETDIPGGDQSKIGAWAVPAAGVILLIILSIIIINLRKGAKNE
jgi:hypothetical protein